MNVIDYVLVAVMTISASASLWSLYTIIRDVARGRHKKSHSAFRINENHPLAEGLVWAHFGDASGTTVWNRRLSKEEIDKLAGAEVQLPRKYWPTAEGWVEQKNGVWVHTLPEDCGT